MNGMAEALELLLSLRNRQSKIAIHGDYDVDGITGTALLSLALKQAGFEQIQTFIPSRFEQGYGLCLQTIEDFAQEGVEWIITVDTGITAVAEIKRAKELGMGVLVCDHHQEGPELPNADIILNPQCKACSYENTFLSGVGVAYKLMETLFSALGIQGMASYLDFFTLGTLADMMPVLGENRFLLKAGMKAFPHSQRPGIQALLTEARIQPDSLRSQDILFRVTPLINAAGRMGNPAKALDLLVSQTDKDAKICLQDLKKANEQRKKFENEIAQAAYAKVEASDFLKKASILVVGDENWHQGVIGIVAARLVERYEKPVAVLSIENGIGKASARSVAGFNWHKALEECQDLLDRWGGHAFAAGFSIEASNIDEFSARLQDISARIEYAPETEKVWQPDYVVPFKDLNHDSMNWLQRFEPFGPMNETPLFCLEDVSIGSECRIVGRSHLKIKLVHKGVALDAIAFGLGYLLEDLLSAKGNLTLVYIPLWNHFRGKKKTIQLQIKAILIEEQ
jgi:single-stranded-DNA-specific exonuclease